MLLLAFCSGSVGLGLDVGDATVTSAAQEPLSTSATKPVATADAAPQAHSERRG